jgi:hypothetical protein
MSTNRIVAKETEWLYEAASRGDTARVKNLLKGKVADVNFHQRSQVCSVQAPYCLLCHSSTAQPR